MENGNVDAVLTSLEEMDLSDLQVQMNRCSLFLCC